jgi:hypothetical protein
VSSPWAAARNSQFQLERFCHLRSPRSHAADRGAIAAYRFGRLQTMRFLEFPKAERLGAPPALQWRHLNPKLFKEK